MKITLNNITLIQAKHPLHRQQVAIVVENGKITALAAGVDMPDGYDCSGLCVSAGWFDMQVALSEPGFEHRENLHSLAAAAAAGGFTDVAFQPNSLPVVQSKESVAYVQKQLSTSPITPHCIAAATRDTAGNELTEMLDLLQGGAVAFSDGIHPIWHAGVLLRSLRYLQTEQALLITKPADPLINAGGQMHEGKISTLLGMKGIPAITEVMAIQRDLTLLRHYGGRIHFSNISTEEAVTLIRQAKKQGLSVSCDIAAYQLAFSDEDLAAFDTHLKVDPPFRDKSAKAALAQGLLDGTIDVIVSAHQPLDPEAKELEFDLATPGISSIETAFAAINTHKPAQLSTEQLIACITTGPRKLLNLEIPELAVGAKACLTVFDENCNWQVDVSRFASLSKNNPFHGKTLKGKAMGIINKGQFVCSPELSVRK